MGPFLLRGLERLGSGKDARGGRQVGAEDLAVIARSVEPLMVTDDERCHCSAPVAE